MFKPLLLVSCWLAATSSHAAFTVFSDEAEFLANAGAVSFDSFEDLTPSSSVASIQRSDYVISSSIADDSYGLYIAGAHTGFGSFATDGSVHLVHQSNVGETLRFDFASPINSFGLTLTDWDDPAVTDGAQLVFGNDVGDEVVVLSVPMVENTSLFFGVINTAFAFSYVELRNTALNEAFGVDGVYRSAPVPVPASIWLFGGAIAWIVVPFRRLLMRVFT